MNSNEFGVQTFTVRKHIQNPESLKATLLKLYKIGFTNFELSRIKYNDETLKVLKELKEELDITYSATQLTMESIKKNFDYLMRFSNELDIKFIEVSVIPLKHFFRKKQGILTLANELNELGEKTTNFGVNLIYHHHNFELIKFGNKLAIEYLFDNTNIEYANFVADTYWLAKSGVNPYDFIYNNVERIKGIHLRDIVLENRLLSFKCTDIAIGQGSINFDQIIALDVDFFSIEIDSKEPIIDLDSSIKHLNKIKRTYKK